MSKNKDISPLDRKIGEAIDMRRPTDEVFEIMLVDYIIEKSNGAGITSLTDGNRVVQCVVNNPEKAQPKRKQNG